MTAGKIRQLLNKYSLIGNYSQDTMARIITGKYIKIYMSLYS